MAIQRGSRVGAYAIADVIGAGGMGEVWRATDTTLERDVAIKVLPPAFAADAGRIARFEQEAKLLASLNHPNIAQVFGLERSDDTTAIVMELVDGPTLADRIEQGPIPPDDALTIALQIADALEAAHDKGIVHRDLKPANIKLRPDGTVKVLDFGIAKAFDLDTQISGGQSPVMTTPVTQAGVILGTAAYMSPEQARGRPVDQRTDIWAFGSVLFEMLTGQPAFAGEDVSITLARVLERETNLDSIPKAIAPAVRHTIALCLRKDPKKRLHSIGDVRLALRGELMPEPGPTGTVDASATLAPAWRRALPLAAALVAGGAIGGGALLGLAPDEAPAPVRRSAERLEPLDALGGVVKMSDDGMRIAYVEGIPERLMLRRLDEFEAGTLLEAGNSQTAGVNLPACFSPDGDWLAYATANSTALRRIPTAGGSGLPLAANLVNAAQCDWGDDGFIYFSTAGRIARMPESGGNVELLWQPAADANAEIHTHPQLLPGGDALLFSIAPSTMTQLTERSVGILDLESRQATVVLEGVGIPHFVPADPDGRIGYLIYSWDRAMFAAPFDVDRRLAGAASPVLEDVMGLGGVSFADVSNTGSLTYLAGDLTVRDPSLTWIMDRGQGARPIAGASTGWGEVSLSPDGQLVASGNLEENLVADIWIRNLDSGRQDRTTFGGINGNIVWTADGSRVFYAGFNDITGAGSSIRSVPTDRSAAPTTLVEFPEARLVAPTSLSPDGTVLIGHGTSPSRGAQNDVWALSLAGLPTDDGPASDDALDLLLDSPFNERHASFSPDGRWIAYVSDETGVPQVYVMPYPGPGGRSQVSTDGGTQPRWNPQGGEIFYLNGTRLMAVEVEMDATFRAGNPEVLFENSTMTRGNNGDAYQYAVAPDGESFLILSTGSETRQPELRIIENWIEELKRQAPMQF